MMTVEEAQVKAAELSLEMKNLHDYRRAHAKELGVSGEEYTRQAPAPWLAGVDRFWGGILTLIETKHEDLAVDLTQGALGFDLHRSRGAAQVLAALNPYVRLNPPVNKRSLPRFAPLPFTMPPLGAVNKQDIRRPFDCVVVPKALLAELMTAARLAAEHHDAYKQPADHIEARLLRAVAALEGLER